MSGPLASIIAMMMVMMVVVPIEVVVVVVVMMIVAVMMVVVVPDAYAKRSHVQLSVRDFHAFKLSRGVERRQR
jgi:hypothetical protein